MNGLNPCSVCDKDCYLGTECVFAAIERWPDVLQRDNVTYRNAVRFGMIEPRPHRVTFYFELPKED